MMRWRLAKKPLPISAPQFRHIQPFEREAQTLNTAWAVAEAGVDSSPSCFRRSATSNADLATDDFPTGQVVTTRQQKGVRAKRLCAKALAIIHPSQWSNRGDWIRTSDLPVPNRTLYQAEPRPDITTPLPASALRALGFSVPNRVLYHAVGRHPPASSRSSYLSSASDSHFQKADGLSNRMPRKGSRTNRS